MEIPSNPEVSSRLFKNLTKSGKLHEHLAVMPPAFLRTYVALGKTRLMTLCITYPEEYNNQEYLSCMVSNECVRSTLQELGSLYYEVWNYSTGVRKMARRLKQQMQDIKWLLVEEKSRKPSFEDILFYWSVRNMERRKKECHLIEAMEDILEFFKIKRLEEWLTLEQRLWITIAKFLEIRDHLEKPEVALLPKLVGQLGKDIVLDIALPDLRLCHSLLKNANEKMRKVESKWISWRHFRQKRSSKKGIYVIVTLLFTSVVTYYVLR